MKRYCHTLALTLLLICSSSTFASSDEKKNSKSETFHLLELFALTKAPIEGDLINKLLQRLNTLLNLRKTHLEISHIKNNASSFTLFHAATLHRMSKLVEKLISKETVNTRVQKWIPKFQRKPLNNITALHIAAYQADLPTVSVILSMKNARRNPTNSKRETPLHMLTQILPSLTDISELTKFMIDKGCCLDRKNLDE